MRDEGGGVSVEGATAKLEAVAFVEEILSVEGFHFNQLMEVRTAGICIPS